jgi:hypothetical protein
MDMSGQFYSGHFTSGETVSGVKSMSEPHRHSGHNDEEKKPSLFSMVYLTKLFSTDATWHSMVG